MTILLTILLAPFRRLMSRYGHKDSDLGAVLLPQREVVPVKDVARGLSYQGI